MATTQKRIVVPTAVIEDPDKNNDLFPPFTVEDSEGKKYGGSFGRLREAVAFARQYLKEHPAAPFLSVKDNRGVEMTGIEPVHGIWEQPTETVGLGISISYPTYDDPRIEK